MTRRCVQQLRDDAHVMPEIMPDGPCVIDELAQRIVSPPLYLEEGVLSCQRLTLRQQNEGLPEYVVQYEHDNRNERQHHQGNLPDSSAHDQVQIHGFCPEQNAGHYHRNHREPLPHALETFVSQDPRHLDPQRAAECNAQQNVQQKRYQSRPE